MFQVIFAFLSAFAGILCLLLSIFTWAASGMATGKRTVMNRVIALSFLAGVALFGFALWLVGVL